jgi:ABC-type transport system involved in multi-copper enzyme maturation permease subunit
MNRVLPMINAEFLKLRTRRGLVVLSLVLCAFSVVLVNAIMTIYHVVDPVKNSPAGGLNGFTNSLEIFTIMGGLAAVLIGATAGAQDLSSGVFRSLVATGQSRVKLALVRIPGGLMVLLPMLALGYALEVVASFVLADGTPTPDAASLLIGAGWLLALAVLNLCVTLGLAALLRSRGTAIGIMIAWELAGSRAIERISVFGSWRKLVSSFALDRFLPGATDTVKLSRGDSISVTVGAAVAVVIAWIVVAIALGTWRTATQDA